MLHPCINSWNLLVLLVKNYALRTKHIYFEEKKKFKKNVTQQNMLLYICKPEGRMV